MGTGILSSVVAVAGFTGLGVAAMYLLDPEQGEQRRRAILSGAGKAAAGTEDALSATFHHAVHGAGERVRSADEYAHDLINRVSDKFSSAADTASSTREKARAAVRDHIHALAGKARGFIHQAADKLHDTRDDLADRADEYRSRARGAADHLAGKHDGHPVLAATGITAGTVGALAIGAGIAYFLDPSQGRSRRGEVIDSVTGWARRVGFNIRQYGRDLANNAASGSQSFDDPSTGSVSNAGESAYRSSGGSENSTFQPTDAAV